MRKYDGAHSDICHILCLGLFCMITFDNAFVRQQIVHPKVHERYFAMMQAADYSSVIMLHSSQSMSLF